MAKNRKNIYTCSRGHKTITIDVDEGVTPMDIRCPRDGCKMAATSAFYQIDPAGLVPTHEFYRPKSHSGLTADEIAHMKDGGLLFRKI